MNVALGLFALSLLGAEGPQSTREAPDITYEIRVLKMSGLDWRGAYFSRLQPVASQGGATVWTVSSGTAHELAEKDPTAVRAPRVTAASRAVAHVFDRTTRKVASGLDRLADGPFDHATQVAYVPSYEEVREGWALTLSGRKIDQGVLACVVLDETRVAAVHQVALTEHVGTKPCCDGEGVCEADCKKVGYRIDVPELAHASAQGEWLIPNDGALLVSLGARTSADGEGKAVVVERLMLIEARPVHDEAVKRASLSQSSSIGSIPLPNRRATAEAEAMGWKAGPAEPPGVPLPMAMPVMPSRSLPQALAADGSPMTLPPLPENPATPSSLPGSSEPCASPQAPHRRGDPTTTVDPSSTKASFTPAPGENEKPKAAEAGTNVVARPCLLRIPLNAGGLNVEVEVRAALPFVVPGKPKPPAQEK
jgi:hypothetical protein